MYDILYIIIQIINLVMISTSSEFLLHPHLVQWLVRQAGQIAHVLEGSHQDLRLSQRGAREAQVLSRHPGLLRCGVHGVDQLLAGKKWDVKQVGKMLCNYIVFLSVYLSMHSI